MDNDSPLEKGKTLLEQRNFDAARLELAKVLASDPAGAEINNLLGLVALRQGERDAEAEGYFRKAVESAPAAFGYYYNLGLALANQKRFADAEAAYRKSAELKPDFAPAHWGLGSIFFSQENWPAARVEYERARVLAPDDPDINNRLGRVAMADKRYEDAERHFRRACECAKDEWTYPFNVGLALSYQKKFKEAAELYRESLKLKADYFPAQRGLGVALFELQAYTDAKAEFEKAPALSPNDDEIQNWLGRIALVLDQYREAEGYFRSASKLLPKEPAYATNLGLALANQGNFSAAGDSFRRALEIRPEYASAHSGLGSVYFELRSFDEAKAEFEKALALAQGKADNIQNWLGRVALAQGRNADAEVFFRKACALNPDEPVYFSNLGLALANQESYEDAEAAYRKALDLKPLYLPARGGLGSIFFDLGKFAEARDEFKKALAQAPENADIHNWMGRVALAQGQVSADEEGKRQWYQEAEGFYRKALELKPLYLPARGGLGSIFFDLGKFDQAKDEFRAALKQEPKDADSHHWLARIAVAEEDYALAEGEFERSIELDPGEKVPAARLYLGALFSMQERFDEAEKRLLDAARIDPKNAECYYELGRLYFRKKKFNKALDQQRIANGRNPGKLREQREIALTLIELERFEEAEKLLKDLVAPKRSKETKRRMDDFRIINQTLANLYFRWGKAQGDELFYNAGIEALDKAANAAPRDDLRVQGQLLCTRGIINCHRRQYATAAKDFAKSIACFESCAEGGGSGLDPTYYVALRNQERLQESFALISGLDPAMLKRFAMFLAAVATLQLAVFWLLYLRHWAGISPKMFATMTPVFFGMILLSLLLPQLSKFKIGGITAEVSKPEQLEGSKTDWEMPRPVEWGYETEKSKAGAEKEKTRPAPAGPEPMATPEFAKARG